MFRLFSEPFGRVNARGNTLVCVSLGRVGILKEYHAVLLAHPMQFKKGPIFPFRGFPTDSLIDSTFV